MDEAAAEGEVEEAQGELVSWPACLLWQQVPLPWVLLAFSAFAAVVLAGCWFLHWHHRLETSQRLTPIVSLSAERSRCYHKLKSLGHTAPLGIPLLSRRAST